MAKSEAKKGASREGGIPRPSGSGSASTSSSPSKLAVRSATNKVVNISSQASVSQQTSGSKHDQVIRTASGEMKPQASSEGPYKLHSASVAFSRGQQKTLVNDKLYPRIPHPGPPMFHPSAPQRSQTLSLIPSHSSSRTKMTSSSAGNQSKVPNMPGNVQVRFGPPMGNDGGGSGGTRMPAPLQPQSNMLGPGTNGSGQQPIKGIMKAVDRLPPAGGDIPPSQVSQPSSQNQASGGSVPYPPPSSSHSHTTGQQFGPGGPLHMSSKHAGPPHQQPPISSGYTPGPNPSLLTGTSQGQANHGQQPHSGGHHNNLLNGQLPPQGQMKIPQSNSSHLQQHQGKGQDHPQQPSYSKNNVIGPSYPPGPPRVGQVKHMGPPTSYHGGHFLHPNHPAHPTPPPYHQPPPPTTTSTTSNDASSHGAGARTEGEELSSHSLELGKRLASAKSELKRLSSENGSIVSDYNKKTAEHTNEIRSLKELNARLSEDNQELRDLCCFLDDDRQKGRKLAREWQRFGRYTASVMRQEVSNYQVKLKDLDGKQQDLIRDNLELKELCLYLDEERGGAGVCIECGGPSPTPVPLVPGVLPGVGVPRDEGDGSSSSTNNDESEISGSNLVEELNAVNARESLYKNNNKIGLNDEVLLYIRNLEDRVSQLEVGPEFPDPRPPSKVFTRASIVEDLTSLITEHLEEENIVNSHRPESVTNAMKVLEVHEQILEKSIDSSDDANDELGDGEKALVREMCNVVWRKLEES